MERAREGGELLFYVVQDGRVKIHEIVAVLHRVAEERLDVLSGVAGRGVVVPGVGVGARTGCVRIVGGHTCCEPHPEVSVPDGSQRAFADILQCNPIQFSNSGPLQDFSTGLDSRSESVLTLVIMCSVELNPSRGPGGKFLPTFPD
jgi:hypothetical protein